MTPRAARAGTLLVRPARLEDGPPLAALYRANRDYLAPFEPVRDEDFYTEDGQGLRLAELLAEREHGRAYPYLIEIDGRLAGRVTVTNVVSGPFCSGALGYWVAADRTGRGVREPNADGEERR